MKVSNTKTAAAKQNKKYSKENKTKNINDMETSNTVTTSAKHYKKTSTTLKHLTIQYNNMVAA
jgi:hypothetical protein